MIRFIATSLFLVCASCAGDAGTPAPTNDFDVKKPGYSPDSGVWYSAEVADSGGAQDTKGLETEAPDHGPETPDVEPDHCKKFVVYGLCQTWYKDFDLTSPTEVVCLSVPGTEFGLGTCRIHMGANWLSGGNIFFGTALPLENDLGTMQVMLDLTLCPSKKEGADNNECMAYRVRLTNSTKWFSVDWFWHL
ncbi:MAG: hypothetical protein HYY51_01600 [Candidatus Magasanikbacteria bacterium]|nr:hypothetical protein [Candidatus Magasanikbacteria bacterium]